MGANAFQYNVKLNLSADTKLAKTQIESLQASLREVSNFKINFNGIDQLTSEINEASAAAMKLQANLQNALNPDTGNLDFSKFSSSIAKSGNSIEGLSQSLLKLGPTGTKAFVNLADSISRSEVPLIRTNKLVNGLYENLKKTAGWQISSSIIHGIMGQYQQAVGYAKALDKSLTDIRIVTGQSADQMARFAKEANAAAKKLNTTTVDYTDASLIYYQQGLSDAEVKKRSDITIKMANATGVTAAKVSDQLTSIWNNFDNGTKSLEYYADVMTALGAATASSTDEIAKGVQKFAAISDTVGLSYEYATSALATITATTRESADTVGNSLKTLFSRIQGLQLGETLDDGTTLNKYSTALAKVGISIKNSNGELKTMDTILNDMGAKWNTLAEDQQMALAQTVGGARQYTQIMTLMENWDFFKENLNTAKTATGTLTQQAEIYADSWEAAQKRVKASLEGLYDNLIDESVVKKFYNLGATIIEGFSSAIAGIGGGSGLFASAAGILGRVFKAQIGNTIGDVAYTLGQLSPTKRQQKLNERAETIKVMRNSVLDANATPNLGKYERSQVARIMTQQEQESLERERRRNRMSAENKILDADLEKSLYSIREERRKNAAQRDQGEKRIEDAKNLSENEPFLFSTNYEITPIDTKQLEKDVRNYELAQAGTSSILLSQTPILTLTEEEYQERKAALEQAKSVDINYGAALLADSEVQLSDNKGASLGKALEKLGERAADASQGIDVLTQSYITEKDKRDNAFGLSDVSDSARDLYGNLLGLTLQERGNIGAGKELDGARQSLAIELKSRTEAFEEFLRGKDGKGGIINKGLSREETAQEIRRYLSRDIGSITDKSIKSFNIEGATEQRAAREIYEGAYQVRAGEQRDSPLAEIEDAYIKERGKLEQREYSIGEGIAGLGSGLTSTWGAIEGIQGGIRSLQDGDIFGGLIGLSTSAWNAQSGQQAYLDGLTDLGLDDRTRQKIDLTNRLNRVQQAQNVKASAEKELKLTDNKEDRKKLQQQIKEADDILNSESDVGSLTKELEKFKDIDLDKVPKSLQSVGQKMTDLKISAKGLSMGLQAAQFAMSATAKINDYFYNEEVRQAQKAATTANELASAYQMAQNNYNSLLSSIEEYNIKTNELADSNLKGAAKQQAIYDQNQAAINLISKYNITDYQRIGNTIKINQEALKQAQEDNIQAMSTAKYASGLATLASKKEANDVTEETLERDLVFDEKGLQAGGVIASGLAGAAIGSAVGSVIPIVGTAIGAVVGTAIGGLIALGTNALGEELRDESFIDKAIEKTRDTGSTSWMDDYSGDEFTADQLKKLKENRSAIKQQAASEDAYEQADLAQRESIASDIIANNDRTENFEYADRIMSGLTSQVKNWEELGDTYGEWYESSQTRIDAAKKIQSELGLTGNVSWEDNKSNKMLTYTTEDGQTGMLSYETLSKMEGVKEGKAGADQYIDNMMETYNTIKTMEGGGEKAAAGMLSLLSGGDFESATIDEINAAQNLLKDFNFEVDSDGYASLSGEQYNLLAEKFGITDIDGDGTVFNEMNTYASNLGYEDAGLMFADFAKAQNYTSPIQQLIEDNFINKTDEQGNNIDIYKDWFEETGKNIYGSMDQATLKDFYSELSFIASTQGDNAGKAYLDSLTGMLQDVNPDKMGAAVKALTSVDWSDWDGLDNQVIGILNEFGIKIQADNEYLQQFVTTIQTAAKSLPNLAASMETLTQVAGQIENLKVGDSIDDATMQALKDQGFDLSDSTFTTWDGKNILTEDISGVKEEIRSKVGNTYSAYMDTVNAVTDTFYGGSDSQWSKDARNKWLDENLLTYDQDTFLRYATTNEDNQSYQIAKAVLSDESFQAMIDNKNRLDEVEAEIASKYSINGAGEVTDKNGNVITDMTEYNKLIAERDSLNEGLSVQYNAVKSAAGAARDPAEMKQIAEQYASTFGSYDEMINDELIQQMIADGSLTEDSALIAYGSQYKELTEYIDAYTYALANGTAEQQEATKAQLENNIALQEALKNYTDITGKKADLTKLKTTITEVEKAMSDEAESHFTEDEITEISGEIYAASDAYSTLSKNQANWVSQIKAGLDIEKASTAQIEASIEATQKLGAAMKTYLMLDDYKGLTEETIGTIIKEFLGSEVNGNISAILAGDKAETLKLKRALILGSNSSLAKQVLSTKDYENGNYFGKLVGPIGEAMEAITNAVTNGDIEAFTSSNEMNGDLQGNVEDSWNTIRNNSKNWEQYQAAMEASGLVAQKTIMGEIQEDGTGTGNYAKWEWQGDNYYRANADGTYTQMTDDDAKAAGVTVGEDGTIKQKVSGGGGGGGGGPTKVGVKSAQELMTRYKVIDQKTTINDMQKTAALQAKDLLYGQSKINQLNTINTLLRKQQQLTTDRITEELDYLEKDKQRIEELIERYNKDAKDEDKINLEYDGFGIITNYKQVIGKWAEELASYYADGELTAEEGKKAEELQKKIQDFTTLIKDYEDSLNQLMTSIETFENTLYELFSNQMEALTYKVQYKIEIEQDDLSYIDFYSSSIKDSYSMMYTYLELVGSKISEMSGQMAIYQSGYEDLIAFADSDPMQLWATQGVEGILTAEQIETARSYRDSMISLYQSAVAARKEIEEQVLRTFDKWNDKINKNITDISRFTDMLAQFKDIINIVGKETLGLSDSFMKTFEQNSINQSMDNIAASKSQYENLVKTYEQSQSKLLEAQQRLEAAKASGDEGVIATAERDVEYWESIADKTQEEMQSAEDTMLTTLNHTLTMISEQFTNAITQAVDDFNDSIYQFNGLDGLVADYEQIREQQDLMVADYEKIYSLNKLNRDLERTLDNSKLTAGRAKLLEIQKEIHDLNKSNVELSRYDLEYLQAKYDLKVAEMELDNARNTKDTVMLSKDSEGNWSYIYSQNTNVVEEAEQKVEDSLFRMQQLSQQYTEEMSAAMMSISQQMRDELAALSIQDFESEEAYYEERKRIQEKYSAQLAHREEELNKAIANNAALYDEDWANYSEMTGYKMSADQDWVDSFSETTLGGLIGSTSDISDYSMLIADSTNKMNEALSAAASTYFINADKALKTYGSSLKTFGSTVTTTTNGIISSSEKAVKEVSTMGATLVTEFEKITDKVEEDLAKWAEDIGNTLTALLEQIEAINKKIAESASKNIPETTEMIGQEEAAELLSKETFNNAEYAGWEFDGTRAVHNGMDIVQFNGELVKDVNEALQAYANAKIGSPAREEAAKKLEEVIADYWKFKKILERIYDPTNIDIEEIETPDITEMASGGYTGEWGNEGKYAVLHEKELVLNKDDTSNFLEALTVSKQLMELIELNARASSQGLGEMHAATIQDPLQNFEQQIQITAEFPDATDHNEIEQAFDNLINMASQYAHRYK